MGEEFYRLLDGVIIDDTHLFNDTLQEWEDYYNYHRPQAGLAGATPYERLKEKTNSTNPDTVVKDVRQLHMVEILSLRVKGRNMKRIVGVALSLALIFGVPSAALAKGDPKAGQFCAKAKIGQTIKTSSGKLKCVLQSGQSRAHWKHA
jgi:hypothetical protein